MDPTPHEAPSPAPLLEIATGYQRARALFAAVELDLCTRLEGREADGATLAAELGLHPLAADRFLNACAALGLLERHAGRFRNSALASHYLVAGRERSMIGALRRYDRASYPAWIGLVERLKSWEPGARDPVPMPEDQGRESLRAQHGLAVRTGEALAASFPFERHQRLLDLGGGTGAMSIALCRAHPHLRAVVLDQPEAIAAARDEIARAGLADRIEVREGDFLAGALPTRFDVALLANLMSVASESENRHLLKRLHTALPSGGAVLLSGWILDDSRVSPLLAVLFCLEDIHWGAPDVERTVQRYTEWLELAGFTDVRHMRYLPPWSLIAATKP
jgi:SAM-dependent methyltransferase